jgi:hypothetical protein
MITSASSVAHNANSIGAGITPTSDMAAIVTVQSDNAIPTAAPLFGDGDTWNIGQMYVDTGDNDNDKNNIWIYA